MFSNLFEMTKTTHPIDDPIEYYMNAHSSPHIVLRRKENVGIQKYIMLIFLPLMYNNYL